MFNSTGNRAGSLKVYYATNGTTWTEITGTNLPFLANNNVAKSASMNITLPTDLNKQATVKLRFYYHIGGTALAGPTGRRPKISIDNVVVMGVSSQPNLSVNPPLLSQISIILRLMDLRWQVITRSRVHL